MLKIVSLLSGLIFPLNAFAYLDPATGSIILQGLIAAVAAAGFVVKAYWYKIRSRFGNSTSKSLIGEDHADPNYHSQEALLFHKVAAVDPGIVFYSEGVAYAPYLRPVIDALSDCYDGTIYYLTSDFDDDLLVQLPSRVCGYYIGDGVTRTFVLNNLTAKLVVMTMPDMNTFHIKRSSKAMHYAYLHHSLVSTHMVYRKSAFDCFDSIFCVGQYHIDEIREWEKMYGLKEKKLVEHGYAPLDKLIDISNNKNEKFTSNKKVLSGDGYDILLAPSWGSEGLMENYAEEIVGVLLNAGHVVHVRPHPRTRQLSGQVLDELERKFADYSGFDMNEDTTNYEAFLQANVMISDWSGVAMEFAFGLEKPVLFIDVPRKVNNPEYKTLQAIPLEVSYRDEIGKVISPNCLSELPTILRSLERDSNMLRSNIRHLREKYFFNIGKSAEQGAQALKDIVSDQNT